MIYKGYFADIDGVQYTVELTTPQGGNEIYEITMADTPVTISTESSGLFAPIKSRSCTLNILVDGLLFDLYSTDPQSVTVLIYKSINNDIIFKGYVTPMNYGQNWTTYDVLTVECVDLLSSLKYMKYEMFGSYKRYLSADVLISHILSHVADEPQNWFEWEWPQYGLIGMNKHDFSTTADFLHSIKFNEANFYDDDDEHTPWTFYEVLEEVCKFLNVSAVSYKDKVAFIDYHYVAAQNYGTYATYAYDLDLNRRTVGHSKNATLNGGYVAGMSELATDDYYNTLIINTNRYDIGDICDDLFDHTSYHKSITREKNFGSALQIWTKTEESGWWIWAETNVTKKYIYKTYCYLDSTKCGWRHHWYSPMTLQEVETYYDFDTHEWQTQASHHDSSYINTPENMFINTLGATLLHYTTLDDIKNKPVSLDWNDVVMFQCAHPTMLTPSVSKNGTFTFNDMFNGNLEKIALSYDNDYELCFSPATGTSWIVIDAKLWMQENHNSEYDPYQYNEVNGDNNIISPINTDLRKTTMFPIEDVTDWKPYPLSTANMKMPWMTYYGTGYEMLKMKLQIGDKYWDGTQWTTTDSTFYISFYSNFPIDMDYNGQNYTESDSCVMLDWMSAISNTDYEDKVGKPGYAIPITRNDSVCGRVHIDIYIPRMWPHNVNLGYSDTFQWHMFSPIIFMKDFKVDYVYTDNNEWYIQENKTNKDIKYERQVNNAYRYENSETLKINSIQRDVPIAKSFPICSFTANGQNRLEYVTTIHDGLLGDDEIQEMNLIERKLTHYGHPTKTYNCHRMGWQDPWKRLQLSDAADLEGIFMIDSQSWDIRMHNNTVKLIEFSNNG